MTETKKLRIWHNSKFGEEAFKQEVADIDSARACLNLLAKYDNYLGDLITSNAQGVEEYVGLDFCQDNGIESDDGWLEWEDEQGRQFEEVRDL